jgi:hypothetical protein
MIEKTIAIYLFTDDWLKYIRAEAGKKRELTGPEVLTTAVVVALYVGGHIEKAKDYIHATKLIINMLDKSRVNRLLDAIGEHTTTIFLQIGRLTKQVRSKESFLSLQMTNKFIYFLAWL